MDNKLHLVKDEANGKPGLSTEDAWAELERLIYMPSSPERLQAMEAAQTAPGELGRLTRKYLLTVAEVVAADGRKAAGATVVEISVVARDGKVQADSAISMVETTTLLPGDDRTRTVTS